MCLWGVYVPACVCEIGSVYVRSTGVWVGVCECAV